MKKLIAFALIIVLSIGCLTGCGGSETDKIIGTWKGTMDLSDAITAALDAEDMGDTFQVDNFKVEAVLVFAADGTYSLNLDEASLTAAFDGLMKDLEEGMFKMLKEQITALGMDMTVDELLAMSGLNQEALMQEIKDSLKEEKVVENIAAEAARKGKFRVEDGKLYTSASLANEVDPETYERYTLEGNTLTLLELVGGEAEEGEDALLTAVYPLIFQKVK